LALCVQGTSQFRTIFALFLSLSLSQRKPHEWEIVNSLICSSSCSSLSAFFLKLTNLLQFLHVHLDDPNNQVAGLMTTLSFPAAVDPPNFPDFPPGYTFDHIFAKAYGVVMGAAFAANVSTVMSTTIFISFVDQLEGENINDFVKAFSALIELPATLMVLAAVFQVIGFTIAFVMIYGDTAWKIITALFVLIAIFNFGLLYASMRCATKMLVKEIK
jgi:hypothetical protein